MSRHDRGRVCSTGKRRWMFRASAELALLAAQNVRREEHAEHMEQRVYLCDWCKGWHLTSKDFIPPKEKP